MIVSLITTVSKEANAYLVVNLHYAQLMMIVQLMNIVMLDFVIITMNYLSKIGFKAIANLDLFFYPSR